MYELLKLISFADQKVLEGKRLAIATIIHTVGSSYRKKGTQMMIADDLMYEGALSGGCVEKEVLRQSLQVFKDKRNVVFEYDGRYKLGCNGRIYVLIEFLDHELAKLLSEKVMSCHLKRTTFQLTINRDDVPSAANTRFIFDDVIINISPDVAAGEKITDTLDVCPQSQLIIIGGEYDSVVLANAAQLTGFRTILIVKENFIQPISPAVTVTYLKPESLKTSLRFDGRTAIVIMTHSLSKDLSYLVEAMQLPSVYMGVLGPPARRNTLLNDLMNLNETLFLSCQEKLEKMKGPIGLNIGARTPEEISISVLGEIIDVFNREYVLCEQ